MTREGYGTIPWGPVACLTSAMGRLTRLREGEHGKLLQTAQRDF